MATWLETAPRTEGRSSSADASRGGGGSLSERRAAALVGPGMRKQLRLGGRKQFDAIFQEGRVWANRLLVLRALPNQLDHNRYGFVTSKRLGNAVVRNRVRRRLREGLRSLPIRHGWDVVVSVRQAAARADFHELKRAVTDLLAKSSLLEDGRDLDRGPR